MKRELVQALNKRAEEALAIFNRNRSETFSLNHTLILSETTAQVIFKPYGGDEVLLFFQWINLPSGPKWWYTIPTHAHVEGMALLPKLLFEMEQRNYARKSGHGEDFLADTYRSDHVYSLARI